MTESGSSTAPPVFHYICTTYPRLSETFLQREIDVLKNSFDLKIHSLWQGQARETSPPVVRFSLWELWKLVIWIPYWGVRRPAALFAILSAHTERPPVNWLNWQETLLGLATGIIRAREFEKSDAGWIHGVWATMPTTFAWTVHTLTGRAYSFGAHAYDLFQDGGDSLLPYKWKGCAFVHTTTEAAAKELRQKGCPPEKILLIRRGLGGLPAKRVPKSPEAGQRVECISVGRLVEKKGWFDQLRIYRELADREFSFRARIIGEGPLRERLEKEIERLNLAAQVEILGKREPEEVERLLQESDLFLFTGKVALDGDRDGLPNVVPEALANCVTVLARSAPGVCEAIHPGETGLLLDYPHPEAWATTICAAWEDHNLRKALARNGRSWVKNKFLAQNNTEQLARQVLHLLDAE